MAQNDNDKIEAISGGELKKAFESFEAASQKLSEYYKNLEEEIKDLKENLNTVLESLPLGILITDENNLIKFINKSLTDLADGYNLVSYLNRPIDEFLKFFFNGSALGDFIKPVFYPAEKLMKSGTQNEKFIPVFLYVKNIHGNNKKNSGRIFIIQNIEEIKKFKRLAEQDRSEQVYRAERVPYFVGYFCRHFAKFRQPFKFFYLFYILNYKNPSRVFFVVPVYVFDV